MVRNLFAGKSSRIVRVLLSNPARTWTIRQLASEAKVSLGLTSIVTNRLIDMGFLVRERSMKLRLRKEEELVKRWASAYDLGMRKQRAYYSQGTLYDIARRITEAAKEYSIQYAFTGSFATDLITQYIRPAEIRVYVASQYDLNRIVESQNLEIAEIGGNVIFLLPEDDSVFYGAKEVTDSRVGRVNVVSNIQLILDLYNDTDRTREAAERLLAKEYERKLQGEKIVKMVKEFFSARGLIADETRLAENEYGPDLIFCNPKTKELIAIEIKASTAKLDSVDMLKKATLRLGSGVKGILVAPSITDAAMKELDKANLQFEPLEVIESGVHKATS